MQHLDKLIKTAVVRKYSPLSTILYQGEAPRSACILLKGIVRVYSISKQGDEQIVAYHVAGEFFPASWIFEKTPSTLFFYEAVTDVEVAFVPRQEFKNHMLSDPASTNMLIDYFATNYAASLIRINALEQPKARDKLAYTMYYLCQRYGKHMSSDVHIPLALTHQNLAGLVGLTRETTATEMNRLRKQGVISYKQQQYTVKIDKLLELIGEDSFKNIKIS